MNEFIDRLNLGLIFKDTMDEDGNEILKARMKDSDAYNKVYTKLSKSSILELNSSATSLGMNDEINTWNSKEGSYIIILEATFSTDSYNCIVRRG